MAKRKTEGISIIRVKKGESLKSIYAKVRRRFTAADLAKYFEEEPMIPARQILAEMEAIHREEMSKKRQKPKRGRRKQRSAVNRSPSRVHRTSAKRQARHA
jgi:hypothetical protein